MMTWLKGEDPASEIQVLAESVDYVMGMAARTFTSSLSPRLRFLQAQSSFCPPIVVVLVYVQHLLASS